MLPRQHALHGHSPARQDRDRGPGAAPVPARNPHGRPPRPGALALAGGASWA